MNICAEHQIVLVQKIVGRIFSPKHKTNRSFKRSSSWRIYWDF